MTSPSPVSPTFLKQKAKQLKKLKGLPMSKALDEVSVQFGFSNYRHYLNVSSQTIQAPTPINDFDKWKKSIAELLETNATEAYHLLHDVLKSDSDKLKRTVSVITLYDNFEFDFAELLDLMKALDNDGLQAVCENIGLNEDVQSELLDYYMNDGQAQVDSYATHPRVQDVWLGDIDYELSDDGLIVTGNFDLSVELQYGSDSDNEGVSSPSHSFPGDFLMNIDSYKNTSLQNAEIDGSSFYE